MSGLVFGQEAARGEIVSQLGNLIGAESAKAVQELLKSASEPGKSFLASAIGLITLIVGATSVFSELQTSLDRIWRAPALKRETGIWPLLRSRLLSFGMVIAIGFLLLVSLVFSAALSAVDKWGGTLFPTWHTFLQMGNIVVGFGITALMASFMSGMAGNVTAFNTVWTYDLYQSYLRPGQPDRHYLRMGHIITVVGILISVACAYAARSFNNIMDMLQLVFGFVNAPLFATFLLGMFWRRATGHGAFFGLIAGTAAAALHHGLTLPVGATAGIKGGWLCGGHVWHTYPVDMAQNFWAAIYAWSACFVVTIVVSLMTQRRKTDEDLRGLVYSLTPRIKDPDVPWHRQPALLGAIVLIGALILNIIFW